MKYTVYICFHFGGIWSQAQMHPQKFLHTLLFAHAPIEVAYITDSKSRRDTGILNYIPELQLASSILGNFI